MNSSIKLNTPVEFINVTPLNPLISKCQIKVCWVGEEANRNRSIITKDVARDLANSLPGSPIVGYYNEEKEDFEEHNRIIDISNGKFRIKDTTRPYGFVDLNAKVWFQKFSDSGIVHEYLMTEGYLWTGQYPEAQRIIERGNNQSMELDEKMINAHWTKDNNGKPQFFIINEAIISKLCILGEDVEPCFEGSQITKVQYSLDDGFKEQLFSMIKEIKEILNEGGTPMPEINEMVEEVVTEEETVVVEEPVVEEEVPAEEPVVEEPAEEAHEDEVVEQEEEVIEEPETAEEETLEVEVEGPEIEEDKPAQYNLDDIQEYVELNQRYSELEAKYNELVSERDSLKNEVASLTEFKKGIDKKEKEEMIKSFYMLSDEDKKDVVENIDTYSLNDIEAKLSIICVRNKVSFDLEDKKEESSPITYNLNDANNMDSDDSIPAWIRAAKNVAKELHEN